MAPVAVVPPSARLDAQGRLIEAETRVLDMIQAAGGAVGRPLPQPSLAAVARLAQRLGITVTRRVLVADGDEDLTLAVRAEPESDGTTLVVTGWTGAGSWRAEDDASRAVDFVATGPGFAWETDAGLRLTHIASAVTTLHGVDIAGLSGAPLGSLFTLIEDAEGALPILTAVAAQAGFRGQQALLRETGAPVALAAVPRFDGLGRFAGLVGRAEAADTRAVPAERLFVTGFGGQLDRALRRPIERIIANAGSMSAELDGPLAGSYIGYADDIAQAGRHLLGLVEDLVDLETVERADFAVDPEAIDLADIARRAGGLLSVRAADGEVRIDKPAIDDALPATGNFRRVLQILVNLIGNAVRYAPRGSVIDVRTERDGERACVIVTDEGQGIALSDQTRIFDKFGRVDPDEPGGSGLGLYISRRLARAMGGDVTVESAPGEGARFVLWLPVG